MTRDAVRESRPGTIAIAGASGVIGAAAVEAFAAAGWDVIALSRRRPFLPDGVRYRHLPLDLANEAECREALAGIGPVSHLVYAAVSEAPGLVAGWSDPALMRANLRMFAHLVDPLARAGRLQRVVLLQGTKAYGAHLHPVRLPAREDRPRDPHANFYWLQEDHLRAMASGHGFGWTIFRPQVVFGGAPGAVMNPVAALGAYAALCRELDLPFACPGKSRLLWEVTDASLLGSAMLWAMETADAANQIFNVTNGDVFVLRDAWPELAGALGLAIGEDADAGMAAFLTDARNVQAWRRLAQKYGLAIDDLGALVGQSHHYLDLLADDRAIHDGGLPALVSTIKIRQAGFANCRDSLQSLLFCIDRMAQLGLLPPDLLV